MSAATSPGTGLAYGLRRVCAAWGMARSSFYAMTSGQHAEQPPAKRRGPKPAISDQALLVAIEADLEASPWEGEGCRKVWARLRVCRDIRVARKRVLRLMRENNLLSPHRCRRRGGNPHDGEIITSVMGRSPSSTFFPRAITATRSFVREASAPAASCILSGVVQEFPGPSRLRLRVGLLQHPSGLEKEPRSGCVRRQALASVRGQRNGCQLHAWSKTIPECQSQARARTR